MKHPAVVLLVALLLTSCGCSNEDAHREETLSRFDIAKEQIPLARQYLKKAGLLQADAVTGRIHGGDAFLIFPADPAPSLNITVPQEMDRPGRGIWPSDAAGMIEMSGPVGSERKGLVAHGRIRFHVARNKTTGAPGPVAVRSFAAVPRKVNPSLAECLALVHRDITAEQIDSGTFELELLVEPAVKGEYSVFVYLGRPMDKDLFGAGWNAAKDPAGANDWEQKHQGLSNLVEVKVSVRGSK